jgi:hypothetical protein
MKYEIAPKSTTIQSTWDEAMIYCFSLNIDGKVGWWLPTFEELTEIFSTDKDFDDGTYWSSTEGDNSNAFVKMLPRHGFATSSQKHIVNHTRAVRTII